MNRNIYLAFLFVVLIVLNYFSTLVFARLDFTEGQKYTLSDVTENVAGSLQDDIEMILFVSESLPSQLLRIEQSVKDTLEEYQKFGNGKIHVTYVDPAKNEEAKGFAMQLQIPEIKAQIIDKDELSVKNIYLGLAVLKPKNTYEGDAEYAREKYEMFEVLPMIENIGNLEYDLTSILLKLSREKEPRIAFIEGHGEFPLLSENQDARMMQSDGYPLRQALEKSYKVETIQLKDPQEEESEEGAEEEEPAPVAASPLDGVDTVVVAGPKEAFTEYEVKELKEYVKAGGNVTFLLDRVLVDTNVMASVGAEDYQSFLGDWGLSVSPKLVADANMSMITFEQQNGAFRSIMTLPYSYYVKVTNFNADHPATKQLETITLPWVSPLEIKEIDGVITDIIAFSSNQYSLIEEKEEVVALPPSNEGNQSNMEGAPEVPQEPQTQVVKVPIDVSPYTEVPIYREKKPQQPLVASAKREGEGAVILIGDADFLTTGTLGRYGENSIFFLNLIDSLTLGEELISIRSKGVIDRPIVELTESEKNVIRWGNIIGVPLLFMGYGLYRKARREKRKKKK